jgi:hypothetical protein
VIRKINLNSRRASLIDIDLKAEGYSSISPETAIRLKNHNVDRDYIRRVKAKGFASLSLEQLIKLRDQDIVK